MSARWIAGVLAVVLVAAVALALALVIGVTLHLLGGGEESPDLVTAQGGSVAVPEGAGDGPVADEQGEEPDLATPGGGASAVGSLRGDVAGDSAAREAGSVAEQPHGEGGLRLSVRGTDGRLIEGFVTCASDNPYPTNPSSWRPVAWGVAGGGAKKAVAQGTVCTIGWFGADRIGVLVMPRGRAPFVAEALPCSPPGEPPACATIDDEVQIGSLLRGSIVDAEGHPWCDGFIRVVPGHGHPNPVVMNWLSNATRDGAIASDGSFERSQLLPDAHVQVQARREEQMVYVLHGIELRPNEEASVRIRLPELRTLQVVVTLSGRCVEGATLRVLRRASAGDPPVSVGAWSGTTDSTGAFDLLIPVSTRRVTLRISSLRGRQIPTDAYRRCVPASVYPVGTPQEELGAFLLEVFHASAVECSATITSLAQRQLHFPTNGDSPQRVNSDPSTGWGDRSCGRRIAR